MRKLAIPAAVALAILLPVPTLAQGLSFTGVVRHSTVKTHSVSSQQVVILRANGGPIDPEATELAEETPEIRAALKRNGYEAGDVLSVSVRHGRITVVVANGD